MARLAVVLLNLGGPDSLDAVRPFLINLFSDPAIIAAPRPLDDVRINPFICEAGHMGLLDACTEHRVAILPQSR